MRITLAIPTNRGVRGKTVQSLLEMVTYSKEIDWHILVAERGYTIAEQRNYIVVQATRNNSDYLLMIDDDMTFLENTLEQLLSRQKDVIGVNSYSRCLPLSSTVGLMDKDGKYMHPDKHTAWECQIPSYIFKAYFVGAGIMLIDMKVFKKIKKPYFSFEADDNGMIIHGEDGSFCARVLDAGLDVWCEPEVYVTHLGEYEYKKEKDYQLIDKG